MQERLIPSAQGCRQPASRPAAQGRLYFDQRRFQVRQHPSTIPSGSRKSPPPDWSPIVPAPKLEVTEKTGCSRYRPPATNQATSLKKRPEQTPLTDPTKSLVEGSPVGRVAWRKLQQLRLSLLGRLPSGKPLDSRPVP